MFRYTSFYEKWSIFKYMPDLYKFILARIQTPFGWCARIKTEMSQQFCVLLYLLSIQINRVNRTIDFVFWKKKITMICKFTMRYDLPFAHPIQSNPTGCLASSSDKIQCNTAATKIGNPFCVIVYDETMKRYVQKIA